MRMGRVVLYSFARTESNSASSPSDRSFEGRLSFAAGAGAL